MRVSDLYNDRLSPFVNHYFNGKEVYIVGSGPSLDCWPDGSLANQTCILLNDVQKFRPRLGPIAFANNVKFLSGCDLQYQIVKGRLVDPKKKKQTGVVAIDNHVPFDDPKYHVFSYRSPWQGDQFDHFDDEALFNEADPDCYWNTPGGTVAIFAMQFALLAGARRIRCIGCDSSGIVQKYHQPKENVRNGKHVKHNYKAYQSGGARMVREAWDRFGVMITSEVPWIGYGYEQSRYEEQREWRESRKSKSI